MKRMSMGLVMGLALGGAWAQQVWRCEVDGQVRYTDQRCAGSGRPLAELKAIPADTAGPAASAASAAAAAQTPASAASPAVQDDALVPASLPPPVARRDVRRLRAPRVALDGLLHTDFVQRGYVPRRQNPQLSPNF